MDGSSIRLDPLLAAGTPASPRDLALILLGAGHRRLAVVAPAGAGPDDLGDLAHGGRINLSRIAIEAQSAGDAIDRAFFLVFRGTRYPTGLICANADLATRAVRCLREFGFRVPGDMTVTWPGEAVATGDPYYPRGGAAAASPV